MYFRLTLRIVAVVMAVAGQAALGQPPGLPSADEAHPIETIELTVLPAPEPRPALKYRLLPDITERKPGNAAVHYYRAIILHRQRPANDDAENFERYTEWTEAPPDKFPKDEAAKWLADKKHLLSEVKKAAYKEDCEWGFRFQDLRGPELYAILIPELQECRELARAVRLKARYEIIDGRYDEAFETLRLGYQLAHDTAKSSLIVGGLVGVAIEFIMNAELEHLIQTTGENYYWAIAALPKPVADVRASLHLEMSSPFLVFPFLKDAETAQRSPEEWRLLIVRALRDLAELGGQSPSKAWQSELGATALMTMLYPAAKEALLASGMDRQRVEAMPVGQAVAIHTARATESVYHEIFKHTLMPHGEAMRRLPAVMKRLQQDTLRPDAGQFVRTGLPIASLFLPAVEAVMQAEIRAVRHLAALQTIEAVRMHAAQTGSLPQSLAQVSVVPVPNNPTTDQPFPYTLDAATGTATLDIPPSDERNTRRDGKRYAIRLRE